MVFGGNIRASKSEISVELFWAGLSVFIIGSIFSGLLGLFVLLGFFNFQAIGYLFDAGVKLFLLGDGLILLSVILMRFLQRGS